MIFSTGPLGLFAGRKNISREIPQLLFWIPPDAERLCLILLSVGDLEVNHLKKRGMAAALAPQAMLVVMTLSSFEE